MHPPATINPAFAVEDVRCAPERLYLRVDLQIAAAALPEDLGAFYEALARTGELRAAARAVGVSLVKARKIRLRLKAALTEMGFSMYRGP